MTVQPHFDDERTVLSARPVVPLEAIEAKVKHRRRWFLGGAFAIAMLLGAASAVISAYFKLRNVPDPEIQSLSVSPVPEPTPELQTVAVVPERPKPKPRNTDNRNTDQTIKPTKRPVLVNEWHETRERRVERPKAQHHDRDLSNIDEIFEGRRRP
ncbi:MAG TPA: hypothetical protein VGK82_02640 [Pyrinomonadaceae bacterium]